jgi:hypothetical protein
MAPLAQCRRFYEVEKTFGDVPRKWDTICPAEQEYYDDMMTMI